MTFYRRLVSKWFERLIVGLLPKITAKDSNDLRREGRQSKNHTHRCKLINQQSCGRTLAYLWVQLLACSKQTDRVSLQGKIVTAQTEAEHEAGQDDPKFCTNKRCRCVPAKADLHNSKKIHFSIRISGIVLTVKTRLWKQVTVGLIKKSDRCSLPGFEQFWEL